MINTKNYFLEVHKIGVSKLPDTFKKSHELVEKVSKNGSDWSNYNSNATIKRMVDLYFEKLTEFSTKKSKPTIKEVVKANPQKVMIVKPNYSVKPVEKIKKTPTTKPVKTSNAKQVERIEDEIALIKSYTNLHQKNKSRVQLTNLLNTIQKAILLRKVNKNSMYSNEIMEIQDSLIKVLGYANVQVFDVVIDSKKLEHYRGIVSTVSPMLSVSLIKRYINIRAKATKEKVDRLLSSINRAIEKGYIDNNDKYWSSLEFAHEHLLNYSKGKSSTLPINEQGLTGLMGDENLGFLPTMFAAAAGGAVQAFAHHHLSKRKKGLSGTPVPQVMTVNEVANQKHKLIGLRGDMLKLIGNACSPTSIMFYGKGGSGKSGKALQLASMLNQLGNSILYVAGEQYGTPTFTELINKVNISANDSFKIVGRLDALPIENFDVVVIDSKDSLGFDQSSKLESFIKAYPNKIVILTSQGTKSGDYAGDGKWMNVVDVFVYCENGTASTLNEKNRWGGHAEIKSF